MKKDREKIDNQASSLANRIYHHCKFEILSILRNPEQILISLIIPAIMLVILMHTAILDYVVTNNSESKINIATPRILSLSIIGNAFTGQSINTGFDRKYGILQYLSLTPIGKSGVIFGKVLATFFISGFQLTLISLLAYMYGWQPCINGLAYAIITLFLGIATFASLGLLLGGMLKAETVLAVSNLCFVLMAAISGILSPGSKSIFLFNIIQYIPSEALCKSLYISLQYADFSIRLWIILTMWTTISTFTCVKYFKWR